MYDYITHTQLSVEKWSNWKWRQIDEKKTDRGSKTQSKIIWNNKDDYTNALTTQMMAWCMSMHWISQLNTTKTCTQIFPKSPLLFSLDANEMSRMSNKKWLENCNIWEQNHRLRISCRKHCLYSITILHWCGVLQAYGKYVWRLKVLYSTAKMLFSTCQYSWQNIKYRCAFLMVAIIILMVFVVVFISLLQ